MQKDEDSLCHENLTTANGDLDTFTSNRLRNPASDACQRSRG